MDTKDVIVSLDNFNEVYRYYEKDLAYAVRKWQRFLNRSSDCYRISTDTDEIKSVIDEVFLECVTNWSTDKKKLCKFRSFLITQLNRRMLNYSRKVFGRSSRIPSYNLIPYLEIYQLKENYPEVCNGIKIEGLDGSDDTQETDVLDSIMIKNKGINGLLSPVDKIIYRKECLEILRNQSSQYASVMKILEEMTQEVATEYNDSDTVKSRIRSHLDLTETQVNILLYRMKKDLIKIIKEFGV